MRVDRVQLGALQAASLPVSLGNKLSSPCITLLFPSIYGKIPANNTSNPSQFIYSTNVCCSVCVGLYCCVCVCVCVCVCKLFSPSCSAADSEGCLVVFKWSRSGLQACFETLRKTAKSLTFSTVVSND